MSILDTLARDHRALESLLTELAETRHDEPRRRVEVFSQLQALLVAHARAEEEVVYRRLTAAQPEEPKPQEAMEEHHLSDILLQELASACPGGTSWTVKVRVFEETLRHHIKEEELQLFPLLQQTFDEPGLATMAREFTTLKHERIEMLLAPLRRATPAFAGRATVSAQAAAGRFVRRGELVVRRALSRFQH